MSELMFGTDAVTSVKFNNLAVTSIVLDGAPVWSSVTNPTLALAGDPGYHLKQAVTFNTYKDDVATGVVLTLDENGNLILPEADLVFDYIKPTEEILFTNSIQADDAVAVLRHIVELDTLVGANYEAADSNINGLIQADDAVAVLRHIVELDDISDRFVLIDAAGVAGRLDVLNSDTPEALILVSLGDANLSGSWISGAKEVIG